MFVQSSLHQQRVYDLNFGRWSTQEKNKKNKALHVKLGVATLTNALHVVEQDMYLYIFYMPVIYSQTHMTSSTEPLNLPKLTGPHHMTTVSLFPGSEGQPCETNTDFISTLTGFLLALHIPRPQITHVIAALHPPKSSGGFEWMLLLWTSWW